MIINREKFSVAVTEKGFDLISYGEEIFYFNFQTTVNDDIDENEYIFEQLSDSEFSWTGKSDLWNKKVYTLRIEEDNIIYSVKVYGNGILGKVRYINSTDFNTSGFYLPAIYTEGRVNSRYRMTQNAENTLVFLTPAPLCYVFEMEDNPTVAGIGLLTKTGNYNFDHFNYEYGESRFALSTDFYEYTKVNGEFELPSLIINVGENEEDILKKYAEYHYENGYCVKDEKTPFKWWYGPLFCGWGDQWIAMIRAQGNKQGEINWADEVAGNEVNIPQYTAIDAANETEYRRMLLKCEEKDITYSAFIIDDKWQKEYGTLEADTNKWRDMRAFVDEHHEKGKKVLLWIKLWNCEGLPEEACVLKDGKPVGVDPTSPVYIESLEKSLYRLLSSDEGCYNADGFKLDFGNMVPIGENLKIYEEGVYGIELLKRLLRLFHDISKRIKPEALISNSCAHPYFREVTDMFRLHDYFSGSNNGYSNLAVRTMLGKTMLGDDILVDTDGMSGTRRRDAMLGFRNCVKFGVPDLYGIDLFSFLKDEDWKEVSKIYREYSEKYL